ncbi:MAG TPA: FAD-dependent oxidoreductase [Candidatus Binataceae bacterium]|nr:FAD-dependent oxidoreductase [Candidatus Binataceae bacterium]
MAQSRNARLVRAQHLGPEARLLTFALAEGQLGFAGGQYIIVNTGVDLGGGKIAKRAYSILSADDEQSQFQIAVRRLGEGPGSNFMHRIAEGTELAFSGPWGKFVSHGAGAGERLLFATDTGITAALGLLRGMRSRAEATSTTALWFVPSPDYFLPPAFAHDAIAACCRRFSVAAAPPAGEASRLGAALLALESALGPALPASAYLAGDGAVIYPLRERLIELGMAKEQIQLEAFFNNPERRAVS